MDALTHAAQNYINTFSGFTGQFLQWGQWLFFGLLLINMVWLTIWYAFDHASFTESMPNFIKKFFVIALFYTIMMHADWLFQILKTAQVMGSTLTHAPIDPSSLIAQGIGIGNKIIAPIQKSSILTSFFGVIIIALVYVVILFVFITIALELALTLIMTTALITVATFFLSFAALSATQPIARQTLDVILANCVKLLGIYLVVAAGSQTMMDVVNSIPDKITSFDPYAWIVAVALLFWLLAKNLPAQFAKIVSGSLNETHGTNAAAMTLSAIHFARTSASVAKPLLKGASNMALKMGGAVANSAMHVSGKVMDVFRNENASAPEMNVSKPNNSITPSTPTRTTDISLPFQKKRSS
jgi:P-type conjugative transfer protein TrbL